MESNKRKTILNSANKKSTKEVRPFEETHKVAKLKLLVIIVTKGQASGIHSLLLRFGASSIITFYGKGTAVNNLADYAGGGYEAGKEIVCSLINENIYDDIKDYLDVRFSVSKASKGVMACIDVNSIAGVMAYKYLSDFSKVRKTYDK